MKLLLTLLLLLFSLNLNAADQQFYFIAKKAPLGSLSSFGQSEEGVYLRWETVEGSLPSEIVAFELRRDGAVIEVFDAHLFEDTKGIDALYGDMENERRRLETMSALSRYGASQDPVVNVGLSNFSIVLRSQLSEEYWSFLASRLDFNVARARHRAYLDTAVTSGLHNYELLAISATDVAKRLAYLEIDLDVDYQSSGAVDLEQVYKSQCTSPEYALDHFTVALHWSNAGTNEAETFLNSVNIAGYDVYRTKKRNATDADLGLDIKTMAKDYSHNAYGVVEIASLEKVNNSLIVLDSDDNSSEKSVAFLETIDQLKKAGIKAGDSMAYYVVSRDFTGNYGPTASILVKVPDLTPPPTPWMIQVANDSSLETSVISFDAVSQQNYIQQFQNYRKFCSHDIENKLYFVDLDKECGEGEVEVNLDVEKYLVYRFGSFEEAANFSDADGDGYSDVSETLVPSNNAECRDDMIPVGVKNYLLQDLEFEHKVFDNAHEIVRFSDSTAFENLGEIYWYRIASASSQDNVISPLSGPIRLYFPDRALPARADIEAELSYCTKNLYIAEGEPYLRYVRHLATDETGLAQKFAVECLKQDGPEKMIFDVNDGIVYNETNTDIFTWRRECLEGEAKGKVKISFNKVDGKGTLLPIESKVLEDDEVHVGKSGLSIYSCKYKYALKGKGCERKEDFTAVIPGQILPETPILTVATDDCVELGYTHQGRYHKIKQECNTTAEINWLDELLPHEIDNICLSVRTHNHNNQISAALNLSCFSILPTKKPSAPSLQSLSFNGNSANFTWLPPVERVNGTLVELRRQDSNESYSIFTPHVDYELDGVRLENNQTLLTLINEEQWCIRARSVAKGASVSSVDMLSQWSSEICEIRSNEISQAQYLPWPEVKRIEPDTELLTTSYNADEEHIELFLSDVNVVIKNQDYPGATLIEESCYTLEKKIRPHLNYVVYRQSISPQGAVSRMIQVSAQVNEMTLIPLSSSESLAATFGITPKTAGNYCVILDLQMDITDGRLLGTELVYLDGIAELPGYTYRFEVVYFDDYGEITGLKVSDPVLVPEVPVYYIPVFSTPIFMQDTSVNTPVYLIGGN